MPRAAESNYTEVIDLHGSLRTRVAKVISYSVAGRG